MERPRRLRKILLDAAYQGELKILKEVASELDCLLGGGLPSIIGNTKDEHGRRALHLAADGGRLDVLEYLIEEIKLDPNVQDDIGITPLADAAIAGRVSAVAYLLRMGVNPEIPDIENVTPLHHAAMKGHNGVIVLLLSKGIDIDISTKFGSPLQYACVHGKPDTVKLLLDQNANPNLINGVVTALQVCIDSKSWQCVELLLEAGADPNGGPVKALSVAAGTAGVVPIIKLLVQAGADPNVTEIYGLTPVEEAARYGYREAVEILFPVTSPISSYVDWSIDGLMKHASKLSIMMIRKGKEIFLEAKSRGTSAFRRKDYRLALYWYTQASGIDPSDAALLSNRSLCYVNLNAEDATQCVLARPNWPKAHYRKGVALKLMNRLGDAADAFFDGLKLDPKNQELEAAFREVSLARMKSVTADKSVI